MTSDPSIPGGPGPVRDSGAGARKPDGARPSTGGPAFRALLEKLESQARGLHRASEDVVDASDLPGAVDRARTSLDDALSLGESLLEAYRAARQREQEPEQGTQERR